MLKVRNSPYRFFISLINILLIVMILSMMISGIIISKHAFIFLNIQNGASYARIAHMLSAYWGFMIMSLHLGLHIPMILGLLKRNRYISRIIQRFG